MNAMRQEQADVVITGHRESLYNYIKQDESAMASSDCSRFFDSFYLTKAVFDDVETNANHRTDKVFFYVRSGLFFFRLMYAKDRKKRSYGRYKKCTKSISKTAFKIIQLHYRDVCDWNFFCLSIANLCIGNKQKSIRGGGTGRKCKRCGSPIDIICTA